MEHGEIEKRRRARDEWADLIAKGWVKPSAVPKSGGESAGKAKKRTRRLLRHFNKQRTREEKICGSDD